jgi:hypothetical protein
MLIAASGSHIPIAIMCASMTTIVFVCACRIAYGGAVRVEWVNAAKCTYKRPKELRIPSFDTTLPEASYTLRRRPKQRFKRFRQSQKQ